MVKGTLYIVATPIGNLADITLRAITTLKQVEIIFAEDTRKTKVLLENYGIATRLLCCNAHNQEHQLSSIINYLDTGVNVALVSDAGTPLISDPGAKIVAELRAIDANVVVIPGPCALIAALSVAGVATQTFCFEGFLPNKSAQRIKQLQSLLFEPRTIILYESTHRLLATLQDILAVFGDERKLVLAKELTKLHEAVINGTASQLQQWLSADLQRIKGEFVLIITGSNIEHDEQYDVKQLLQLLSSKLSTKDTVELAIELTGKSKNYLYNCLKEAT